MHPHEHGAGKFLPSTNTFWQKFKDLAGTRIENTEEKHDHKCNKGHNYVDIQKYTNFSYV